MAGHISKILVTFGNIRENSVLVTAVVGLYLNNARPDNAGLKPFNNMF